MTTQYRHVIKRRTCPWGCGGQVDQFVDEIGLTRRLETEPIPITWDLNHPNIKFRIWEHRGQFLGWCLLGPWELKRGPRPLRVEHICEATPRNKREGKS